MVRREHRVEGPSPCAGERREESIGIVRNLIACLRTADHGDDVELRPREEVKRVKVAKETGTSAPDKSVKQQPVRSEKKAGPNDPCPCGSGKKYKKCCMQKDKTSGMEQ